MTTTDDEARGTRTQSRAIGPRKRFGQHFLAPAWAREGRRGDRAGAGRRVPRDRPGHRRADAAARGDRARPILAVEIDRDLVRGPGAAACRANVTVMSRRRPADGRRAVPDAASSRSGRRTDAGAAPPPRRFRVVGNLPYNLASPILFRLVELHRAARLLRRRDGDGAARGRRSAGRHGPATKDYGVLTVMLGVHARVDRLLDLPPGAFKPAPKVRSAVVRLAFGPPAVRDRRTRRCSSGWSRRCSASGGRRWPTR